MERTMNSLDTIRVAVAAVALATVIAGNARAQSLEEQMRRPPGTNSLDDDSQHLRGRTADQDGTNSLDNGSMDGGDASDND